MMHLNHVTEPPKSTGFYFRAKNSPCEFVFHLLCQTMISTCLLTATKFLAMHLCFLRIVVREIKKKNRLLSDLKLLQNVANHSLLKLCKCHEKIDGQFLLPVKIGFIMLNNGVYIALYFASLHRLTCNMPLLLKVQ